MKKFSKLMLSLAIAVISVASFVFPNLTSAEGKTYTIATDITFAPFEFQDTNGDFVGIDIDLLNAIAENQGFNVEIKPLGFNAAVQALESKQVDGVIAGMSITDERERKFDFSEPYFESGVVMAIAEGNEDIASYEDLKGKRVAVKTLNARIRFTARRPQAIASSSVKSQPVAAATASRERLHVGPAC